MVQRPLLMIPGPIEVSSEVIDAMAGPPPSHVSPAVIEAFGASLQMMRTVWKAPADAQPFIVSGSGSTSMDMAANNLVEPGDRVLVVNTGYFGDRAAEMLKRRGAEVSQVTAKLGEVVTQEQIAQAAQLNKPALIWATHVDTSTGVRIDPKTVANVAKEVGAMTVFDGVCATAGEQFDMQALGADAYLTASQKAIGLPPGLALLVVSDRAMKKRAQVTLPPPMSLDFEVWLPIMQAYEARKPSYFATPATPLIMGLQTGLNQILSQGVDTAIQRHQSVADAFRGAWASMGLKMLPTDPSIAANTLSAVYYPDGIGAEMVKGVAERGAIVAGGLHPVLKAKYFRVGHMGYSTHRKDWLMTTIGAIGGALNHLGHTVDPSVIEEFEANLPD